MSLVICLLCIGLASTGGVVFAEEPPSPYLVGPEDELEITVWDNPDLSVKSVVSLSGYIDYHLIGKVEVAGLSTAEIANKITAMLADGFLVDPQVTVKVAQYRSLKIFIIGEVNKPGTFFLSKPTNVVEAISMAMGPTRSADNEIIIVRQASNGAAAENITVDLRKALEGDLTQNIPIKANDSIYVSKAKTFYIMGEVNHPGQYDIEQFMTIRRAISIAGGATEKAAINKARIYREINGKEEEMKVELFDIVQPNDTVNIPQSIF